MSYSNQVSAEEQAAGFELMDVDNPTSHLANPLDFALGRGGASTVQAAIRVIDPTNRIAKVEKPAAGGKVVYVHETLQGNRWHPGATGEMYSLDHVRQNFSI